MWCCDVPRKVRQVQIQIEIGIAIDVSEETRMRMSHRSRPSRCGRGAMSLWFGGALERQAQHSGAVGVGAGASGGEGDDVTGASCLNGVSIGRADR